MKKLAPTAIFLLFMAFLILRPDPQDSAVSVVEETPPANEAAQDLRGPRPAPPRTGEEVELSLLGFDQISEAYSEFSREELIKTFNPDPLQSESFIEALAREGPLDRAKSLYKSRWEGFVNSLSLTDLERSKIRDILIAHEMHNLELRDLVMTGQISADQHTAFTRPLDQLANILAPMLSEDQITEFWNYQERRSEQHRRQIAERNAGYLENGMVGILDAANRNDAATVQAYINSGADVNAITLDGRHTPLLDAISGGNTKMTQMLLAAGADPNMASADGYEVTPVRTAAKKGNIAAIRALAAAGADLNFAPGGSPGLTPLVIASQYGQTDAAEVLLELGADATGEAGARALTLAVRYGNPELEQILIEAGAQDGILTTAAREFKEIGRRLGIVNN